MNIHKKTRLTPEQRKAIYHAYFTDNHRVADLARDYRVSRPTIYKVLHRGRRQDFSVHTNTNQRFRCLRYGIKRLAKFEAAVEAKLKQRAKQYNTDYPGQMIHADTRRLPLLEGDTTAQRTEYLFVAIDDYSRELYAAIRPRRPRCPPRPFWNRSRRNAPIPSNVGTQITGKNGQGRLDRTHVCKPTWMPRSISVSPESAAPKPMGKPSA